MGGDHFEMEQGSSYPREILLDWLAQKGYERSELVWSPGQFVSRGSIIDIFSPSDPYPVRLEFFDDEIESIRFFDPETQKSLRTINKCSFKSLISKKETELEKYLPNDMRVIFFDPKGLDMTAENSVWLWQNLERDTQTPFRGKSGKNSVFSFTKYKRIRVTRDATNTSFRLAVNSFTFRGRTQDVEHYCEDLAREGISVEVFSESKRTFHGLSQGYPAVKGVLSEGFVDTYSKGSPDGS